MTVAEIVALVGAGVALIGLFISPTLVVKLLERKWFMDDKKAQEKTDALVKKGELNDLLKPITDPINEKLDSIQVKLDNDSEATVLDLRVQMKTMRDRHVSGQSLDTSDISTWKELYSRYYKMGGNHFKEYVNGWGKDIGLSSQELKDLRKGD